MCGFTASKFQGLDLHLVLLVSKNCVCSFLSIILLPVKPFSVLLADVSIPFPSPELTVADDLTPCGAWHTGGQVSLLVG